MKGLLSTGASRAWFGVALAGLVVVALVVALTLIPRLGAGQRVIDAAAPAFTDARVDGHAGGRAHALAVRRRRRPAADAARRRAKDAEALVGSCARKLGVSTAQVRKILRREAPHTEALTRALPLDGVADEIPRLTAYLATILARPEEQVAATARTRLPAHLAVADGAAQHRRRVVRRARHRRADAAARRQAGADGAGPAQVPARRRRPADGAGTARTSAASPAPAAIGYIPYLLLAFGAGLLALRRAAAPARAHDHARQAARGASSSRPACSCSCSCRRAVLPAPERGAEDRSTDFEPVFTQERVRGAANGVDTMHEAIELGDPIMTAAAARRPRCRACIASSPQRTGRRPPTCAARCAGARRGRPRCSTRSR